MSGTLWAPFREGNRSEYLAQYFLSALGVSTPVPRQEDIGIDFYCALASEENQRLTFHSPFTVQVGSIGSKEFKYGGLDKKNRWRAEQLDWLYSIELPLFLATVDKGSSRFSMYSISQLWPVRYAYGSMGEIHFVPDATSDTLEPKRVRIDTSHEMGDKHLYRVPLGQPVVSLSIEDLKNGMIPAFRTVLTKAIHIEMRNLIYRNLNVHFGQWLIDISVTKDSSRWTVGQSFAWNAEPGKNTEEQIDALIPIVTLLAHNFKAQNRLDELKKLRGVFSLIKREKLHSFIQSNLPELFED